MNDGLNVASRIAHRYKETSFLSTEQHIQAKYDDELDPKMNEKERYMLYHRRFAQLTPAKIAKFHEVTTRQEKIRVPEVKEICEVCALTKMRINISKQLRDHKVTKLALIQFDIA